MKRTVCQEIDVGRTNFHRVEFVADELKCFTNKILIFKNAASHSPVSKVAGMLTLCFHDVASNPEMKTLFSESVRTYEFQLADRWNSRKLYFTLLPCLIHICFLFLILPKCECLRNPSAT